MTGAALVLEEPFDIPNLEDRTQLYAEVKPKRRLLRHGWDLRGWVCLDPRGHRQVMTWYRPASYIVHFAGWYRTRDQAQAAAEQLLGTARAASAGEVFTLPEGAWVC